MLSYAQLKTYSKTENRFNILFKDSIDNCKKNPVEGKNITSTRHTSKIDTSRNSVSKKGYKMNK